MAENSKKEDKTEEGSIRCANKVKADLDKYYKEFEPNWKAEENMFYGDIFNEAGKNKPYENLAFQTIEDITAILTDSDPVPVVKTDDPAFEQQVEVAREAMEWVFRDQSFIMKRTCAIRNGLISAPGYLFFSYDHNANNGDGANKIEVLRRDQVKLDGAVKDINEARKAWLCVDRDKEWLKLRYPSKADEIEKLHGKQMEKGDNRANRESKASKVEHRNRAPGIYKDDELLKLEITYKRDYSTVKISEEETLEQLQNEGAALSNGDSPDVNKWQDHDAHIEAHIMELASLYEKINLDPSVGFDDALKAAELMAQQIEGFDPNEIMVPIRLLEDHIEAHEILKKENPKGERPKYRGNWRVIEVIDNKVMRDGEHEHDHLMIPIAPYYANKDDTIYGFSEARNLFDPEAMRAVMSYKEYKGLQRVANPIVLASFDSGITEDNWTNEDGAFANVEDVNNSVRHFLPGQVSNQVGVFQEKKAQNLQTISGVNFPSQGQMPHSNASGFAISKLQNQAVGRFRLKTRLYESHSDMIAGKLLLSDIQQFWVNEKILRLQDQDNEKVQVIYNPLDMQDLRWEIEMQAGSMSGVDKDAFNSLLFSYVQAGILTPQVFFEMAELPKKERILEFLNQQDQQGQEMQAAVEQATAESNTIAEQAAAQLEQVQVENLKLKAQLQQQAGADFLSPDEVKQLDEILRQEALQSLPIDQAELTEVEPEEII